MRFVRSFMNRILAEEFASPDLEFVWQDAREQDPAQAAQIDVSYGENTYSSKKYRLPLHYREAAIN